MTKNEIEHMWKVASNDPNHDTNWHNPVVVAFAKLVADRERDACAKIAERKISKTWAAPKSPKEWWEMACKQIANDIRARGQA